MSGSFGGLMHNASVRRLPLKAVQLHLT